METTTKNSQQHILVPDRKMVIVGCGTIGSCVLDLLDREIVFREVVVLDRAVPAEEGVIPSWARFESVELLEENYEQILSTYLEPGDICCNLSVLESQDIMIWCQLNDVLYLDTSGEEWECDNDKKILEEDRNKKEKDTLYGIHLRQLKKIQDMLSSNPSKKEWPTAVLYHGMNPGLVNQFMKRGLLDLADTVLKLRDAINRDAIKDARNKEDFPELARALGVKVIHVAERDSQVSSRPRYRGEFVSTWSVDGFEAELQMYSELTLGTHERTIPSNATTWNEGPPHSIALGTKGAMTRVFSWVPSGPTLGYLTCHDESLTMGEYLTIRDENGNLVYRPTILFSYMPCDLSVASIHEFIMNGYKSLSQNVLLKGNEITSGRDEVGILLLGHQLGGWWTGSIMSREDARKISPKHSATTLQVAAGVVSALHWMILNPKEGIRLPEELPHEDILGNATPYLQPFVSLHADFDPLERPMLHFYDYEDTFGPIDSSNEWMPGEDQKWQLPLFLQGPSKLKRSPFYVPAKEGKEEAKPTKEGEEKKDHI